MKIHIKIRRALLLFSVLLFPITMNYLSPYVIVDGAAQGLITASAISFAILFLSSMFLGRAFCSHLCPAGGSMELLDRSINGKRAPRGISRMLKFLIWVPWLGTILWFYWINRQELQLMLLHLTETGISVDEPFKYINYLAVLFLLLIPSFVYGKRGSCHTLCWMAPFMILGRKLGNLLRIPSLRLRSKKESCIECGKCTKACPMSLDVQELTARPSMEHSDCILCGECRNACTHSVIHYGFGGK